MKTRITPHGLILFMLFAATLAHAQVYYVKNGATGLHDGSTWANAYSDLQAAIDAAQPGDSIWVAAGTYYPTAKFNGDSLRNATFYINKDILLFGGFSGGDGTESQFDDRDPKTHVTILSGDLGVALDSSDNAFHVMYIDHVSDSMRLDGFTITLGNNIGAAGFDSYGAGIFNNASSGRSNPVIANSIISHNVSDQGAGGMMTYADLGGKGNPTFINSHFSYNQSSGGGGAMFLSDTEGEINPLFIGCFFQANTARTAQGSAVMVIAHSSTSNLHMINCVVTGNESNTSSAFESFVTGTGRATPVIINSVFSGNSGGAVRVTDIGERLSTVTIRNSIFSANSFNHGIAVNGATEDVAYSAIEFGFAGEGIVGLNPEFVDPPSAYPVPHTLGDVHLLPSSPAIDAGRNSDIPSGITADAEGHQRIVNSNGLAEATVDIGAFEYQDLISATSDVVDFAAWTVLPNPAHDIIAIQFEPNSGSKQCYLLDAAGNLMRAFHVANDRSVDIDARHFPAGAYVLMAVQDGQVQSQRIIIQ